MSPATATAPARAPLSKPSRPPGSSPARPRTAPAHRPAPARPDLYVVKPTAPPKRSANKGRLGIISVGLLFVVAFAIAILQTVIVQGQMQLDDLQQQISDTQAESQRLQLEAADLSSPTHIVEQAQSMGMVAAPSGLSFVTTVDGEAPEAPVTTPEPATPVPETVTQVASPESVSADETAAATATTTGP